MIIEQENQIQRSTKLVKEENSGETLEKPKSTRTKLRINNPIPKQKIGCPEE